MQLERCARDQFGRVSGCVSSLYCANVFHQAQISSRKETFVNLVQLLTCSHRRLPITRIVPGQKIVPIKTQARSATILPNFVGLKFQVHNGKNYTDITITEDMVGHKLGEFAA
jgi:ribosomal protein S19